MEGKTVIVSVLVMSLVMAHVQVGAGNNVCCPNEVSRGAFNMCRRQVLPPPEKLCAEVAGCKYVSGTCPPGYKNDILENSRDNAVNEYCKLGCASSVCGALTSLENSDASEIAKEAVKECTEACSTLCNKGYVKAPAEIA